MSDRKPKITDELEASKVINFLIRHPDFLIKNPELFNVLTPPNRSTDNEIVDFQNIMIEKIKSNLSDLQFNQGNLIN